jgi:uncharacterized membrane protein HdeD (DUF308 family)
MFIEPDAGAVAIIALIATFMIVTGVMQIGFAIELRKLAANVRQHVPRQATTTPVMHG